MRQSRPDIAKRAIREAKRKALAEAIEDIVNGSDFELKDLLDMDEKEAIAESIGYIRITEAQELSRDKLRML